MASPSRIRGGFRPLRLLQRSLELLAADERERRNEEDEQAGEEHVNEAEEDAEDEDGGCLQAVVQGPGQTDAAVRLKVGVEVIARWFGDDLPWLFGIARSVADVGLDEMLRLGGLGRSFSHGGWRASRSGS